MPFTGRESHDITKAEAAILTRNHRQAHGADPSARKALFFGKDALMKVLSQPDCVGIRCYFGRDTAGKMQLVLVGANAGECDMLDNNLLIEQGLPCPPFCDTSSSVLNGG